MYKKRDKERITRDSDYLGSQWRSFVTGTLRNHCPPGPLPTSPIFYFKLPYIGHFSVRHLMKRYCNDLDIKLVFSSFKIGKLFSVKDPMPGGLRSRVVYKFACAGL